MVIWTGLYLYKHSTASKSVWKIKLLPDERLQEYDLLYVPMLVAIDRALPPTVGVFLGNCSVQVLRHSPHSYHHPYVDAISILTLSNPKRPKF